ncbi:hypothetical protein [Bosea sp. BK604]|uniref:hypothetical protein n=1 Tax=Bosea sp. BK604 TaxID=2512180 RepID=UPI00104C480C|nr:hypothetical protein [Bosea sp. BK604]TCR65427.1 hypothetical protein EV560_105190 [Bosea sp. BK604]
MFGLDKTLLRISAVIIGLVLAGLAFWAGMAALDRMESRAAEAARAERDAHWRAEIAASNAVAERERAEQLQQTAAAESRARAEISSLSDDLADLERRNATLPNADACGLDRDRVRLLDAR